jgi:hypothetical protein
VLTELVTEAIFKFSAAILSESYCFQNVAPFPSEVKTEFVDTRPVTIEDGI